MNAILKMEFSILCYWLVSSDLLMIMPSDECHITWANVDSVPCRLMASLGHKDLDERHSHRRQTCVAVCVLLSTHDTIVDLMANNYNNSNNIPYV